jgi:hypothetical protein
MAGLWRIPKAASAPREVADRSVLKLHAYATVPGPAAQLQKEVVPLRRHPPLSGAAIRLPTPPTSRQRVGAYLARLCFLGGMLGFWFYVTQYLQGVLGYSPVAAGLAFLPTTVVNFAAAVAVPRLTARLGSARLLTRSVRRREPTQPAPSRRSTRPCRSRLWWRPSWPAGSVRPVRATRARRYR